MIRAFFAGLFSWRGLFTLLGLVAISLVIWFLAPPLNLALFGYPDMRPFATEIARIGTIAGLFAFVLLIALIRFLVARHANRKMIASLLDAEQMAALADDRSGEEVAIIRERFEAALKVLKDQIFPGKRGSAYLFELPWYIIIGPPGAGKTTILRHSGLEFPLAERVGGEPVTGIGGTRNCDWWFTDQAVLIDTAGRYTTQDVNTELDRAAWVGFLDLLKTYRRRRPVNGVILAISLADILGQSEVQQKRHVEALRKRIQELMRSFGMQIPIYVLITKCDLFPGFNEYFDDLTDEERAQVWGMTLPVETASNKLANQFETNYRDLAQRLERGLPHRLHAERNMRRRASIFAFPKEFASARNVVGSFVYDVFRPSRFDVTPLLRGVYLTSGTQEGTPIDRLLGALGRSFGLAGPSRSPFSGKGKAFFIRRLLSEVVFEEQDLVGADRKLERRLALVHTLGYVVALGVLAASGLVWYGAYSRSAARVADTDLAVQAVEAKIGELKAPVTFAGLLPVLDAAKALRDATGESSLLAWVDGLGLSATPRLAPLGRDAYDRLIVDKLYPAFVDRVASRLQGGLNDTNLEALRDTLRVYISLDDSSHFDRPTIARAARAEVPAAFPVDPDRRSAMSAHIDRMLELLPKPVSIDRTLIAAVRSRLTREPRTDQIYARLLREGAQSPQLRILDFAGLVGNTSLETNAARSTNVIRLGIPGIFTRDGFYNFVLPRLPALVREEQGSDWVIASGNVDDAMFQRVTRDVLDRYVQDYIKTWTQAISAVSAVPFTDLARGNVVLQGLAGPQSPLDQLIQAVRDNTTLPIPGSDQTNNGTVQQLASANPLAAQATQLIGRGAASAITAALGDAPWPGQRISDAFQPLTALTVPGPAGQPPIARTRDLLSNLYSTMSGVANAPEPQQAAYQLLQKRIQDPNSDVFGNLRADSALRPEPVRSILRDLANSSWGALLTLGFGYVNDSWRREVMPVCEGVLFNRYPVFANVDQDMTLRDFSDFFRSGGIIDDFFNKYLKPLVVDQRTGFGPARIDGVAVPLKPDSIAQFQRARLIRNAFFSAQGSAPAVKFSIRPTFMHPNVLRATLTIDGRDIVYRHEAPRAYDIDWPTRTESSAVSVTLTMADGTEQRVEKSGPWSLFRLVEASHLVSRGAADRFEFTIGQTDGPRITYELRASSVTNPFSLSVLRAFRCPDTL